jgi:hypothetical protein
LTSSAFAVDGGTAVDANSAIAKSAISLGDISGGTLTRSYCSGVIVSPHTIITAAHCLAGKDPTTIMVLFGPNGNTTTVMRLGAESHIPDQYQAYGDQLPNAKNNYDIGVLKFSGDLPEGFQPAVLESTELNASNNGSTFTIAGFGLPHTGELSECNVTLLNSDFSNSEFELSSSLSCTPDGGDSGGPDFRIQGKKVILFGLHNWGWHDAAGNPNMSVEVKISFYAPWIASFN